MCSALSLGGLLDLIFMCFFQRHGALAAFYFLMQLGPDCTNVLVINLQPCSAKLSKVRRLPKLCCSLQELLYSTLLGIQTAFYCNYIFVISSSLKL